MWFLNSQNTFFGGLKEEWDSKGGILSSIWHGFFRILAMTWGFYSKGHKIKNKTKIKKGKFIFQLDLKENFLSCFLLA
jgi:hypothetical protein